MAKEAKKDFAGDADRISLICSVELTEAFKNKFFQKFQENENLKNDIEQAHRSLIEYFEECMKLNTIAQKTRQIAQATMAKITLEKYTNVVYEILCRIAIIEGVDNITSLEQFYEESIWWAKIGYISICINHLNGQE